MYGAQFQNRKFFSRNNNASDEQFSLALQYVSSLASSALPDKETREGAFVPPSQVLDALKSEVKVGLSMRGLVQAFLTIQKLKREPSGDTLPDQRLTF